MMNRVGSKYKLTVFLIFANVLVYVYTAIKGGDFLTINDNMLMQLGQYNFAVLFQGQYWQLLTSMFVHVDITHIALNMFFLLIFGLRAEDLFDEKEYLLIYLFSGFAGNVLTLLLPWWTVSAGASGAIFGLFGANIIYMRKAFGRSIFNALLYSLLFLILSSASEGVNILAHLGGLIIGLLIGYLIATSRKNIMPQHFSIEQV